jgi:hypothetical protein
MLRARVANWILKCAVAPADREAAIGDLAEEFEIRMRRGSRVDAAYWYWSQVLRSIPWFLWTPGASWRLVRHTVPGLRRVWCSGRPGTRHSV